MAARSSSKKFLSRAEVAQLFQVSPNTITRWAKQGKLPFVQTLGGHRRYEKRKIERLVRIMGRRVMPVEKMTLAIHRLYADHHTNAVRKVLAGLAGLGQVWASASTRRVTLEYDPQVVSPQEIVKALAAAGYTPGEETQPVPPPPRKDPAWDALGLRETRTNPKDLDMSGEFRKY